MNFKKILTIVGTAALISSAQASTISVTKPFTAGAGVMAVDAAAGASAVGDLGDHRLGHRLGGHQTTESPASTDRISPVTHAAKSEQRKSAALATSFTVQSRPSGAFSLYMRAIASLFSGSTVSESRLVTADHIAVSAGPGQSALTLTW